MKKRFFCTLFLAAFFGPYVWAENVETNVWGNVINNIQIGIGTKDNNTQIKTNQSFNLGIRIKNLSTNESFYFYLPAAAIEGDPISFVVTSPSGKDVSPIPPRVELGSGANVNVPPNQIYTYVFNLSYLCKFDEIGTYKVTAKMNVSATQHKSDWAISNPLYVTVVPDQ
jgi:hypothetical protein